MILCQISPLQIVSLLWFRISKFFSYDISFRLAAHWHRKKSVHRDDECVSVQQEIWYIQEKCQRTATHQTPWFGAYFALVVRTNCLHYRRRYEKFSWQSRTLPNWPNHRWWQRTRRLFELPGEAKQKMSKHPFKISLLFQFSDRLSNSFSKKASCTLTCLLKTMITWLYLLSKDLSWTVSKGTFLRLCSTRYLYQSTRIQRLRRWIIYFWWYLRGK